MRQLFRTHRTFAIGILLWLVLFSFYSATAWQQLAWPVFSSPDESANFAFAQQVRRTGAAAIPTAFPGSPRSVINAGGELVPGSFAFFPYLIGTLGKILGTFGMLTFGPALAAAAVLAFWSLTRSFLGRTGAWCSAISLATFPTFWFYASRGLWQNGVFVSMLIVSVWLTVRAWHLRVWAVSVLAGIAWGATVAIRPSEVSWLAPALLVFLVLSWRTVPWKQALIAACAAIVPVVAMFAFQQQTYGTFSAGGYRENVLTPAPIVRSLSTFQQVKNIFFPFGTNPEVAWQRLTTYGIGPLSYVAIPGLVGFLWLVARSWHRRQVRAALLGAALGAGLLVLMYGNFSFVEYPAVREPVLDFSYLRYWLPLAVLECVGIGSLFVAIQRYRAGRKIAVAVGAGILMLNLMLIGFDETIGLRWSAPRMVRWQAQSQWLVQRVPAGSLVVAGSNDKLLFPRRQVIGYNGVIQPGIGGIGDVPVHTPVYALVNSVKQAAQVAQRYPMYLVGTPMVGPGGITLVQLFFR